jgi:BirA family biotin operon repressor/biotin-[acetyl-CoA-carboxylase] ligase
MNEFIEACESTNTLAKESGAQGAPDGTWIAARIQTGGRGRQGRQWASLPGNLHLSLVKRIPEKQLWTWVPIAVGVGLAEFLNRKFGLDVRIKWPNDLVVLEDGVARKLGGILCESQSGGGGDPFLVVGLGLNCKLHPEGLEIPAASLAGLGVSGAEPEALAQGVVDSINRVILELRESGGQSIRNRYDRCARYKPGETVSWGQAESGRVLGLGPSGELLVDTPGGVRPLFAEEIHFRSKESC